MIRGIGIDSASIEIVKRSIDTMGSWYTTHVFTIDETIQSQDSPNEAEYLASRFAVKEATFKAIAHLLPERTFDMRIVETIDQEDGHPEITLSEEMQALLDAAGASELLVSITTQNGLATAVVLAQG